MIKRGARIATRATIQTIETQFSCHQGEPNQANSLMTDTTITNPSISPPQKNVGIHALQLDWFINNPARTNTTTITTTPIPRPGSNSAKKSETILNLIAIRAAAAAIMKLTPLFPPRTFVDVKMPNITAKIRRAGRRKSNIPAVSHFAYKSYKEKNCKNIPVLIMPLKDKVYLNMFRQLIGAKHSAVKERIW